MLANTPTQPRLFKMDFYFSFDRYGDMAPKSILARIFSVVWILLSLIIMAIFMANVTSALTSFSLQLEPSSLDGVDVSRDI